MNLNGELVGINSQILTPTGGNIGLGFAIPSNMAREVMGQLKADGRSARQAWRHDPECDGGPRGQHEAAESSGALVSDVEPGSAASARRTEAG